MSIAVYSEWLSAFGADRAAGLVREGVIDRIYAYLGPSAAPADANATEWSYFRNKLADMPLWGWYVCSPDQEEDAEAITRLDWELSPVGWLLNIEKPLEGAGLQPLLSRVAALGKPMVASLAGANPNHYLYDHRTMDRYGVEQEWQAYFDSDEGPWPEEAVWQLYAPTRLLPGGDYRAATWPYGDKSRVVYGWGAVDAASYRSFNRSASLSAPGVRLVGGWPPLGVSYRSLSSPRWMGTLLGLARYSKIRVALDVTRGAAEQHTLDEWAQIAASARLPGLRKRPVSVYLAEVCPDAVLRAIARGAG
ncbi:MAG: hypothetical protein KatS3mg015_2834 [Fimbriimonadales bacterium]|nr:MAG: hypothetical protein KatS3mg015_2834 [Fimbriimonadales bacterium]